MDKLALFDIDRTIVKSSTGRRAMFSSAIEQVYGIKTSTDIIQTSGMTDQEIIFEVLKLNGLAENEIESKIYQCMDAIVDLFEEGYGSYEVAMLNGTKELLDALDKNNILMGLATGNLEPIARGKMKKLGLDGFFPVGGFGNEHIDRTELIKIAIEKARLKFDFIFSDNVYLFGDAPQDMAAGKKAGIIPIGVSTGIYPREQLENAGASLVLDDLADTDSILEYISK